MGKTQFDNYYVFLKEDASNFLDDYFSEFLEKIKNGDTDAYDMIDYSGELHNHCDQSLDLREIADILEQSNSVEEDWGLWEGIKDPEKALEIKAFYTYKGNLLSEVMEQFSERLDEENRKLESEIVDLEEKLSNLDEDNDDEYDEYQQFQEKIAELQEQVEYIESGIESL